MVPLCLQTAWTVLPLAARGWVPPGDPIESFALKGCQGVHCAAEAWAKTNAVRMLTYSAPPDPVPGKDHVWTPWQQTVANHRPDHACFVRVSPATMEDILIFEAEITRESDPLSV
jgi:hypothetical protein